MYRLGTIGSGSFRQDIAHWWTSSVLKKENAFFKQAKEKQRETRDIIWALKDVSFDVDKGDAFGIIGTNGSGKSTLLKIISRIVRPTKGSVRGDGKVGSILEVGTGFNAELTGRENIYISGYLLGMTKNDVKNRFDEIVAFSGIEKFIDTPVKRYSSGMYVRLAFAVAAHLEPEILIVDEVLAVGDADFQSKCLGKMQEVSNSEGRTVLFVSHNLQAVANLCDQVLWLDKGITKHLGRTSEVIDKYIGSIRHFDADRWWDVPDQAPGNDMVRIKSIRTQPISNGKANYINVNTPIQVDFEFWCYLEKGKINVNVQLYTLTGECVFDIGSPSVKAENGVISLRSIIPGNLLNNIRYSLSLTIVKDHSEHLYVFHNCATIEVEDDREGMHYFGNWPGVTRPRIESTLQMKRMPEGSTKYSLNK
jgi:lipopolysaccharide transport system ATP-binding protein